MTKSLTTYEINVEVRDEKPTGFLKGTNKSSQRQINIFDYQIGREISRKHPHPYQKVLLIRRYKYLHFQGT